MKNKKRAKRISLESEIITTVFNDNRSTVHFDYHVNIDADHHNIKLDLYTRNAKSNEIFLLHQTKGNSSIDALIKMIDYLRTHNHDKESKNSYKVSWYHKSSPETVHVSYFFEPSESAVHEKFFYNRNKEDFSISISLNPLS